MSNHPPRNKEEEPYSLDSSCTIIRETDAAIHVSTLNGLRVWIPNSQVHPNSEIYSSKEGGEGAGSTGELVVNKWWAAKQTWYRKVV